uniref:Enoyl reductase (ER) domain-containing protein n=1 Tax=Panagrellus redivivus TaxID=6233 RepID=A0A7E4W1F8_PANRE
MRAAQVHRFGPVDNIFLKLNVPVPKITPSQVLVRVKAAGVNPVDTYIRSGNYANLPTLPYSPGREGAGIVEEIGAEVTSHTVGGRVWFTNPISGSAAEFAAVEACHVFPLPDNVSFTEGAGLGIAYLTAYRALFVKARAQAGESVFIHGATGGVGLAAVQMGKAHGLRIFGTAGTEEGIAIALANGAERVVNHNENDYVEKLLNEHKKGFDVILEMLANVNLNHDLALVGKFGRICVIGNRGQIQIDPRSLMQKESSIIGVMLGHTQLHEYPHMAASINSMLTENQIKPVIHHEYALSELAEAHRQVMEKTSSKGKIVVNLDLADNTIPDQPEAESED